MKTPIPKEARTKTSGLVFNPVIRLELAFMQLAADEVVFLKKLKRISPTIKYAG
jgi:hypothetical protein